MEEDFNCSGEEVFFSFRSFFFFRRVNELIDRCEHIYLYISIYLPFILEIDMYRRAFLCFVPSIFFLLKSLVFQRRRYNSCLVVVSFTRVATRGCWWRAFFCTLSLFEAGLLVVGF